MMNWWTYHACSESDCSERKCRVGEVESEAEREDKSGLASATRHVLCINREQLQRGGSIIYATKKREKPLLFEISELHLIAKMVE